MTDRSDTLWKEADEELKQENFQRWLQKNAKFLLGAAFAVVMAVAGWKLMEARKLQRIEATGDALLAALRDVGAKGTDAKTAEAARSQLEGIAKDTGGPALFARLRLASLDADAGKAAEAVKAFDAIGAGNGEPVLTLYAKFRAALLRADTADWTEMQNRLTDVGAETSPWRHQAREILSLAAIKADKTDEASKQLELILADRATPQGISERARLLLTIVTEAEAIKAADAKAGPLPTGIPGVAVQPAPPVIPKAPTEKAPPQKGTK